jgi:hypothetical protein
MMNVGKTLTMIATLATVWGVTYMHECAHRYDIIAVGAGNSGTQNTSGDTEIKAFIIDHQTGRVWRSTSTFFVGIPVVRMPCDAEQINSVLGCSESPAQERSKKLP